MRAKLMNLPAGSLDSRSLCDVAEHLLETNEGIALAAAELFPGVGSPRTLTTVTDASGEDGVGGECLSPECLSPLSARQKEDGGAGEGREVLGASEARVGAGVLLETRLNARVLDLRSLRAQVMSEASRRRKAVGDWR